MWTKEESDTYSKNLAEGKLLAEKLGRRWGKSLKRQMKPDTQESSSELRGIDHIDAALAIEPLIETTDYGYETLGTGLKSTIDLYVGRKCAKVIPLLIEVAKRLNAKGCTSKDKAHEGGGADHWYWVDAYRESKYDKYISMQWNTQGRSYYVELRFNSLEEWKLYVAEYKYGENRAKAKAHTANWDKEPGYVLEYTSFGKKILTEPHYQIDDCEAKNAWVNLAPINRWMDMINTVCTSLDLDLYGVQFNPDKTAARQREKRIAARKAKEAEAKKTSATPAESV